MSGVWLLSWRHVAHHKVQSAILTVCIGLSVFLPVTTEVLIDRYQSTLTARARSTPLLLGAKGNRFDLTLAALYFRGTEMDPVPFGQVEALAGMDRGLPIPLNVRHTAQTHPIVGTSPEYFEVRRLRRVRGTLPLLLGDVLLGADVAQQLGLDVGGTLSSDPKDALDIASPNPLRMKVCGVLAKSGTPDDQATFVGIQTCWLLEGAAHGHKEAETLSGDSLLGKKGNTVAVSPAVKQYEEVTEGTLNSFHVHGDPAKLPLSAVMVVPNTIKDGTLLHAHVNLKTPHQMVVPTEVIDDLMAFVFRIKRLLDTFSVVLAMTTGLMLVLQLLLSMRLRAREMVTLNRIGCSPGTTTRLYLTEIMLVVAFGGALAGLGVLAIGVLLPDLVRMV